MQPYTFALLEGHLIGTNEVVISTRRPLGDARTAVIQKAFGRPACV
jgi:hypothetical protein